MQSSLGIYIDENVIKYAKLQKDKDIIKVEAYNVTFYDDDLDEILNRIVNETYSYKVPISLNVSNEMYHEFEVSTLLSKKDAKKAIDMEYEMLCSEKGYNKVSIEHKYLLADKKEEADKQKALSILVNRNEITKKNSLFEKNKIATLTPISTSIANLVNVEQGENIAIVNIEAKTKITTIIDGQIYKIDTLDEGMKNILDEIDRIENSYSKSYEVCKNMAIYTQNSSELYSETSEYMDMVTSNLYKIVIKVKEIINSFFANIDRVYITGLGTCINNIDLYFQEYIPEAKCEILKPYFVNSDSAQLPIKEYIEVNSAIALALDGLGMVNKEINFSKSKSLGGSKADSAWNQNVDFGMITKYLAVAGDKIKKDFTAPLQSFDKTVIRASVVCIMLIIVFSIFSNTISSQIKLKTEEISAATTNQQAEISKISSDVSTISARTSAYKSLIAELTAEPEEDNTNTNIERVIEKDSIPNLLNRIMFVIPKKVKLTSIENTTSNHIVIKAEAEKYEQLGYFKAVLTTNEILKNVKSTSGQKNSSVVQVTIEGDLP